MCRVIKCTVCHKVEHHEQLHTPPCATSHEVWMQCQACKDKFGDIQVDPKASSSYQTTRPVPAKRPAADEAAKRRGADLLKTLVTGRVRRKLTEVQKAKTQSRAQAEAAANAMIWAPQQQQPPPVAPQAPSSEKSDFGAQDLVLEDADENAALQQFLQDRPEEVTHYLKIIRQDNPDLLQHILDKLENHGKGKQTSMPQQQRQSSSGNAFGGDDVASLPVNVALDVAPDDRDDFMNPFSDRVPGAELTLAQIAFMLPDPGSNGTTFDFTKPAPPPDTSGLIQFDDDDDEDLQRFIGIGDDDNDA
ncbi:uncharacterized protein PG986_001970 [Apiospora aurea]|uniref:Uncharacterized protein n=1 Tax=Apiospora aurea TaxID=335848 RepID=A0ABR1QYG2_9PEZI